MSYGAHHAQLNDDAGEDRYPSLAHVVREETDGGRLVVRFLVDAMQGQLEDAKPCHRLDAARQLLKLGMDDARAYVADNGLAPSNHNASNNRNGHYRRAGSPHPDVPPDPPLNQELADFIRLQTEGGRVAVRFLVDVMRGDLEGFKPHHRLSAAKELLRLCRDDHHDGDNDYDGHEDYDGDEDDYDDEDSYDEEDKDEETYPYGIRDTLYQAYKDDEAKLDEAITAEYDLRSAYYERKEARADARNRPDHDDHDEETYPSDTLHTIYDTYKDDPDELLEAIKRELETYPGYEEKKKARAHARAWRDAEYREAGLQPPGEPKPPPTPPAASTEEPGASEDPPPQEPEEHRPAPTGLSHYERKAMSKGLDIWRDPAGSWVSADPNPTGYQPSTRIDSTSFPRGP